MAEIVSSVLVKFPNAPLQRQQVDIFRGFINEVNEWKNDLFHNHKIDSINGVIYRYPLIQFRAFEDAAAIWALQEGVGALSQYLHQHTDNLPDTLLRYEWDPQKTIIKLEDSYCFYHLRNWLPFNKYRSFNGTTKDNWSEWKQSITLREKTILLERILTGQLLDFCKNVGFRIPDKTLKVEVTDFKTITQDKYPTSNGTPLTFTVVNLCYRTNLILPEFIGLGKGKSKGFGWQTSSPYHTLPILRSRNAENLLFETNF